MLKIIKIIFFSSIFFLNLNLIGDEFKTIVKAKDEDISILLQKALDQSMRNMNKILKIQNHRRDQVK